MLSHFSTVWLFVTPWTVAHQAPLSMGCSRQEYWNGLLCPAPGDLPNPGIKPPSLRSPALAGGFFTTTSTTLEAQRSSINYLKHLHLNLTPKLSPFGGLALKLSPSGGSGNSSWAQVGCRVTNYSGLPRTFSILKLKVLYSGNPSVLGKPEVLVTYLPLSLDLSSPCVSELTFPHLWVLIAPLIAMSCDCLFAHDLDDCFSREGTLVGVSVPPEPCTRPDAKQVLKTYLVSEFFHHRLLTACVGPHLSFRYNSLCPWPHQLASDWNELWARTVFHPFQWSGPGAEPS